MPPGADGAGLIERETVGTSVSTAIVPVGEFGVFHALADRAHQLYLSGYSERAVEACRAWRLATRSAGDTITTRYLSYIEGVALQQLGRHHDAVTVSMDLLVELEDDDPDPMWRAKALALLAEASSQAREVSRAMDALAEASWLVSVAKHGKYSHLSASTAVAVALRTVFPFEQADELMAGITLGDDMDIDLLVVQERAVLAAFWATTLLVVGRDGESGPHLVRCAELALRMGRIAAQVGNTEMFARAGVIEAYSLSRLGYTELAAARVNAVIGSFPLRDDLVETHLTRLVLGQAATESGDSPRRASSCARRWPPLTGRAGRSGPPPHWRLSPTSKWLSTANIRRSAYGNDFPGKPSSASGSSATAGSRHCRPATRCAH